MYIVNHGIVKLASYILNKFTKPKNKRLNSLFVYKEFK